MVTQLYALFNGKLMRAIMQPPILCSQQKGRMESQEFLLAGTIEHTHEERYVSSRRHVNIFFIQFFRGQGVDKWWEERANAASERPMSVLPII
jgi:hypothetical protein